jgi:hypothetical protein
VEFFLVPLIAIVVVTFGIYKLTAMIFHIHLSGALLILLVVFAWLVSLVLPGLFFQTAGFLGSVGISLVSAVGFAWLATAFDAKQQPRQMTAISANGETLMEPVTQAGTWTPPAESAAPLLPKTEWQEAVKESIRSLPTQETQPTEEVQSRLDMVETTAESVAIEDVVDDVQEPGPILAPEPISEAVTEPAEAAEAEIAAIAVEQEQPEPEWVPLQDVAAISDAFLIELENMEPDNRAESQDEAELAELAEASPTEEAYPAAPAEAPPLAEPQPASDSLEDLLEFSFAQRSQGNTAGALMTFRLIRGLYADSQALPMVVAEIVSILQSQGQYEAAIDELTEIMRLPTIQQEPRLVRTFVQKLNFLQLLRDLVIERGSPGLPFEQVPAEWQAEIEQGLLAGDRVQS